MASPLLSLQQALLTFGGKPLFEDLSVGVEKGQRICLVGRNGSGKSSLLKSLAGVYALDRGHRFIQPGVRVSYLYQDPVLPPHQRVLDYLTPFAAETYEIEAILSELKLPGHLMTHTLSGGETRRVALAQTLIGNPSLLLLDEPTNHLDMAMIQWLEKYLQSFNGGLVVISHDRCFLRNISTHMWWLDRGRLHERSAGFAFFDEWSEQLLDEEQRHFERLEARLRLENEWLHRGVTARRKRNQGRLRGLMALRQQKSEFLKNQPHQLKLEPHHADGASQGVIEAIGISIAFGDKKIVQNFSTRILKNDRIGIIGPNGAGKSTLIKVLLGYISPDTGTVRHGQTLKVIYFDQMRETLDPQKTLWQTLCPQGGDQVFLSNGPRHVAGYLKDFLFTDHQIHGKVGILSGGEKNRLGLALALSQPSTMLVLDEPTNDLDMETLDLLIELLGDYAGTLLIISHDRDFLDATTTSLIAVEGQGMIEAYVGSYADYLQQRKTLIKAVATKVTTTPEQLTKKTQKVRLTYNQKKDYEELPGKIEKLEAEIDFIEVKLSDPDFYTRHPEQFVVLTASLEEKRLLKEAAETKWLELELLKTEG